MKRDRGWVTLVLWTFWHCLKASVGRGVDFSGDRLVWSFTVRGKNAVCCRCDGPTVITSLQRFQTNNNPSPPPPPPPPPHSLSLPTLSLFVMQSPQSNIRNGLSWPDVYLLANLRQKEKWKTDSAESESFTFRKAPSRCIVQSFSSQINIMCYNDDDLQSADKCMLQQHALYNFQR